VPGNTGAITVTDQPTGVETATVLVPAEDTVAKHIQRVALDHRMNAPAKRYLTTVVLTPGAAAAGTNLLGLRKLNANADVYIHRIVVTEFHSAAAVSTPTGWKRATTVAAGAPVAAADLPKLDTGAGNATLEVRTGAVTGTKAAQYLLTHEAPATAAPAAATGGGYRSEWVAWDLADRLRLTGDEGLILDLQAAGDVDTRYHVTIGWEEA
jgi:hypothetical protein